VWEEEGRLLVLQSNHQPSLVLLSYLATKTKNLLAFLRWELDRQWEWKPTLASTIEYAPLSFHHQ
jgi:hypothetical protein